MRNLIEKSACSNVLLAGDLNAHFDRNSSFTNIVADNLDNLGLVVLWENIDNDPRHLIHPIDYTFLSVANGVASSSIIDHFCTSSNLYKSIKEAGVLHDSNNLSNHSPIFLKIDLGDVDISHTEPIRDKIVSWAKATTDAKTNYKNILGSYLNESSRSH